MTNVEGHKPEGAPERSPKAGEGAASAFSLMQGCLFVSTKDTSPERSEDGAIIKALRVSIRTLRPSVQPNCCRPSRKAARSSENYMGYPRCLSYLAAGRNRLRSCRHIWRFMLPAAD
jgi:hypothetical protein